MGLAFSAAVPADKTSPSWSYSGFNAFRGRLANEIGIKSILDMKGFGGSKEWSGTDAIEIFLNHSDCDGCLTPDECLQVAPRLQELISRWGHDDNHKERAERLARMMQECGDLNMQLEFR